MSRKNRRTFTAEHKAEAVKIYRESGKALTEVARNRELSHSALRAWVEQAEIDEGNGQRAASALKRRPR